jgi:hypothetical protein
MRPVHRPLSTPPAGQPLLAARTLALLAAAHAMSSHAAAQALAADPTVVNLLVPIDQTSLVAFFRAVPRYGLPTRVAPDADYIFGVITAGIPWLVVAAAVLALIMGASLCCGRLRRTKAEARHAASETENATARREPTEVSFVSETSSAESAARAPRAQILAGALLFNAAFGLIGLGLVANASFRESLYSVFDAIRFAKDGIVAPAVAIADFAVDILDRVSANPTFGTTFASLLGGGDVANLRAQALVFSTSVKNSLVNFEDTLRYARIAAAVVFFVAIVLFLLLLTALFALFSMQSTTRKRSTCCATTLAILPVILAWVAVALISIFAVLTADSCVMLSDFQKLILAQADRTDQAIAAGIDGSKNILFSNNVKCPEAIVSSDVLDQLAPFIGNQATTNLFDGLVATLYPGQDAAGTAAYTSNVFKELRTCDSMVLFAGRLNYSVCQSGGPVLALFVMWLVIILLATLLTISVFLAKYSILDMTRFYSPRGFNPRAPSLHKQPAFIDHTFDTERV